MALCSIAIAAGIVGVVAVVKRLLFARRFGRGAFGDGGGGGGGGGDCGGGGGGCGGGARWRGWRRWGAWKHAGRNGAIGRSFWLRALYARLDTTPGQEREIRAAIEELRERAWDAKSDLPETRENIAKSIAGETFDEAAFEAVSARLDATAEKMKDAFASAMKRIHAVLDPKQRERLASIVGTGGFRPWGRGGFRGQGGPYRGGAEI